MATREAPRLKLTVGNPPSFAPSGNSDFSVLSTPPRVSHGSYSHYGFPFRLAGSVKDEEMSMKLLELLSENQELRSNLQETIHAMKEVSAERKKWKDGFQDDRREMQGKCEASVLVVTGLKHKLQQRDTQIAQLKLEVQQLKVDTITQDPVAIHNELREKNAHMRELRNRIEELELGSRHNKEQLDQLAVYKESLKRELQEARLGREQLSMEAATFKAEHEVHRRARIHAEDAMQILQDQVDKLREENRILHQASPSSYKSAGSAAFVMVPENSTDPKVVPNMQLDTSMAEVDEKDSGRKNEERDSWKMEKADLVLKLERTEKELAELKDAYIHLQETVTAEVKQHQRESYEKTELLQQHVHRLQHQLTETRDSQSHNSHQDLTTLKSQVVSLMYEVGEAQNKRQYVDQENAALREKCDGLQRKQSDVQQQLKTTRDEDDHLILTLRQAVKHLETKTLTQQDAIDVRSKAFEELQQKHAQLCTDHRDLYLKCEGQRGQISNQASYEQDMSIDSLTAQLLAASETLETKKRLIRELMKQKMEMRAQIEMIPVHVAQLEVYKQDFETERLLREDEQHAKEDLAFKLRQVMAEKLQLQDQLSRAQRERGASPPAFQHHLPPPPPHSSFPSSSHSTSSPGAYEYSRPGRFPYGQDMCDLNPRSASPFQGVTDRNVLQNTDAALENLRLQENNPIRTRVEYHEAKPPPDKTTTYECPKCNRVTSDMESLERHFVDCLDMSS